MNRIVPAVIALFTFAACTATSHPVQPAALGTPSSVEAMLAVFDQPGPIELTTVASANWEVPLEGLLNLNHPAAKEAGLKDRPEPIQVFFHTLRHPTRGTWFVDSGMESAFRDAPDKAAVRGLVASFMNAEKLEVLMSPADWLKTHPEGVQGVFLTHLHLDHLTGLPDLPAGTALYVGPGEARERALQNMVVQGTADRQLAGKGPLNEWAYARDPQARFEGVLDVFGDGSVFALLVPGHTAGSTAYVVRTPKGPVLLTGDACHSRFGWDNGVEPGTFSADQPRSAKSLAALRTLAAEHPALEVRLGHQR